MQLFSTNHNYFLQTTTFFYKSQLFSTNHNFFLQIATIFYKPQLFSANSNYFLHSCNFFLQIATIFYKPQLFSTNRNYFLHSCNFFLQYCNFFLQTATFFYKSQLFSTILQLFSIIDNFFLPITTFFCKIFFPQKGISESLVWIKEKSAISLVYHICREVGKWIALAASRSARGASNQPIFMGDCLTICHMYLPCLPGEWVSFCLPGAIAVSVDVAWT